MHNYLRAASLLLAASLGFISPAPAQQAPAKKPALKKAPVRPTASRPAPRPPAVSPVTADRLGIWQGQAGTHRIILTLGRTASTLTIPEMGQQPDRIDKLRAPGDSLTAIAQYGKPTFRGRFTEQNQALTGTYTDYSRQLPVTLHRVAAVQPLRLAQAPVLPLPYRSEEVQYGTPGDSIRFGGTLTHPAGQGRVPAVVLLSGTGPQNRNGAFGPDGHQPFEVLADHLTRRGIAVLRADDRGVGQTTGHYDAATTADFAHDALVAVRYLRQRPDIDPAHVGLIGHSEGGAEAILAAAEAPTEVAFVVSLSGLLGPGLAGLVFQNAELVRVANISARDKARFNDLNGVMFQTAYQYADSPELEARLRAAYTDWKTRDDASLHLGSKDEYDHFRFPLESYVRQATGPWYRYHLRSDPTPALRQVKVPVLALNGDRDLFVDYHEMQAAATTLREAGNRDVTAQVLPGLNHLLQPCRTCLSTEYSDLDTTIAPVVLQTVGDWLVQHTR